MYDNVLSLRAREESSVTIAQKILSNLGVGDKLFYITGIFTLIYWAIIVTQFVAGPDVAHVPSIMNEFYITVLATYVGVNQVEKVCDKEERQKRPGKIFVWGWSVLAGLGILLVAFHVQGDDASLNLIWPFPFGPIIGIYGGTLIAGNAKKFIEETKKAFSSSPQSPPK